MVRVYTERVAAAWLGHGPVPRNVQVLKDSGTYVKTFTERVEAGAAVGYRALPDVAVFLGKVVQSQFFK